MFAKLFGPQNPIFAEAPTDQVFVEQLWEGVEISREEGLFRAHSAARQGWGWWFRIVAPGDPAPELVGVSMGVLGGEPSGPAVASLAFSPQHTPV